MLLTDSIDYTVQIEGFEGPLDLLLRLIEREELDITTLALARVADAYLAHVRAIEAPDPASLSAFLVIAARLLLLKSRALLPRPEAAASEPGQFDDAERLVQQLREYQRYKQVAGMLRQWEAQGRRSYTRLAPPPLPIPSTPLKLDATMGQMIAAVQRRMQLVMSLEPQTVAVPTPKILTVAEVGRAIRERLQWQEWFSFEDLLSLTTTRIEVVVTLWAVLELVKRRAIVAEQRDLFSAIMIGRGPELVAADMNTLDEENASQE